MARKDFWENSGRPADEVKYALDLEAKYGEDVWKKVPFYFNIDQDTFSPDNAISSYINKDTVVKPQSVPCMITGGDNSVLISINVLGDYNLDVPGNKGYHLKAGEPLNVLLKDLSPEPKYEAIPQKLGGNKDRQLIDLDTGDVFDVNKEFGD